MPEAERVEQHLKGGIAFYECLQQVSLPPNLGSSQAKINNVRLPAAQQQQGSEQLHQSPSPLKKIFTPDRC